MKIILQESQFRKLVNEIEKDSFYFDPTDVSDDQWKKITKNLTKMGYESRPFTDWKEYFLRLGPRNMTHKDHITAIMGAIVEKPQKTNSQKIITKAKRYFGVTNNFKSAGYLLIDGSFIDFSGNKFKTFGPFEDSRSLDHRQINQIGIDMIEFMSMGNIRLQTYGIDITQMPTNQQIKSLKWFLSNIKKKIIVEFTVKGQYETEYWVEYAEGTNITRIINDIIRYYRDNIRPTSHLNEDLSNREWVFYDLMDNALKYVLYHIKEWKIIPPFNVINPNQYKMALQEFIRYGEFIRFPEKIILGWKKLVLYNIALLGALTDINGHSANFPHEEIYYYFGIPDEHQTQNFQKDWEILFGDKDPDEILPTFTNGQPILSDFGMKPLYSLALELVNQERPEDIIVTINKILDVVHQRSDLPELFIKGGSKSQYSISNNDMILEMEYPSLYNITSLNGAKKTPLY